MLNKLFSSRRGELLISGFYAHSDTQPVKTPGPPLQVATNNRDYHFTFQEFAGTTFKARFYQFGSKVKETYTWVSDPMITLRMGIAQSQVFQLPHLGKQVFHQRDYNLLHIPHFSMEFTLGPDETMRFMDIMVTEDYIRQLTTDFPLLQDFLYKTVRGVPAKLRSQNAVAAVELLHWTDKLTQFVSGDNPPFFSADQVVEQIFKTALTVLLNCPSRKVIRLNLKEVDKLYRVAEFLENYDKQISVQQLTDKFKISTYKLERGFKDIFGHSVLQHRFEEKMRLALRLIDDKKYKSKQVAEKLQYSNAQSFSRAFKKRFGYAPYRNAPKS